VAAYGPLTDTPADASPCFFIKSAQAGLPWFTHERGGTFRDNEGNGIILNYYVDNANTQGADSPTDTPGSLVDTFSFTQTLPGSDSFSHSDTTPFATSSLFSMTMQFSFTLAPGASLTSHQ
jgi:hypothetical protein